MRLNTHSGRVQLGWLPEEKILAMNEDQNNPGTPDNNAVQNGAIAHERVSSPGQGVGGQEAPSQSGHGQEFGAFGNETEHHPAPGGQVNAGQDQMAAGQTAEKSQQPDR